MDLQKYVVTPWKDIEEFNKVYKGLFSEVLSDQQDALEQIGVWRTRCSPDLPSAVEATDGLKRALLQLNLMKSNSSSCQHEDVKLMLMGAVIRFVNLTVDHIQQSMKRLNMFELAKQVGIPEWIIDIRHDSSHSSAPSVPVLTLTAETSLSYLEERFWKELLKSQHMIQNPDPDAYFQDLIIRFKKLQFHQLLGDESTYEVNMAEILKSIGDLIFKNKYSFFKNLVKLGNLINIDDMKRLIPPSSPFFQDDEDMVLPQEVLQFWSPLLCLVHEHNRIQEFVEELVQVQVNWTIKICQKLATSFCLYVLSEYISSTSTLAQTLRKRGPLLSVPHLIICCTRAITPYSVELLKVLVKNYEGKKKLDFLINILKEEKENLLKDDSFKMKYDIHKEFYKIFDDDEEELEEKSMVECEPENESVFYYPAAMPHLSNVPIGAILNSEKM